MRFELKPEFSSLEEELEGSVYYSTWGLKGYTMDTSSEIEKMRKQPIPQIVPEYIRPFLWSELAPQPPYIAKEFIGVFIPAFPEFISRAKSKISEPYIQSLYESFVLDETYDKKIRQLFGKHLEKLSVEDMVKTREFLTKYFSPYKYAIIRLADTLPHTRIEHKELGMRERFEIYALNEPSYRGIKIVGLNKESMTWTNLLSDLEFKDFARLLIKMLEDKKDKTAIHYVENGRTFKLPLMERLKMYPGVVESKSQYTQNELNNINDQLSRIRKTTLGAIEEISEGSPKQEEETKESEYED